MDTTVAFISDVHSNLEALEAVLEKVGDAQVYCLGDIVGYGASPNEVVTLLRERRAVCIMGNHDLASFNGDVGGFNSRAAMAAVWTSRRLTPENSRFLGTLPQRLTVEVGGVKVFMAHGSPDDPLWEYVFPGTHSELFGYYLKKVGADVIALGHTHVPFEWKGVEGLLFNPGSVGQPRDGDPRASYALLTVGSGGARVEEARVSYDIEKSAKKILEAGLPSSLALRLFGGD